MDQVIEKLQNADTIMEVTDLCKFFKAGKKQVLKAVDHVTVSIKRGETLGLVGESGCGKTTCGRTMMKLYEPTSGKVVFDGKDISTLKGKDLLEFRKNVQIIFQDPYASLDPRMTVSDIIAEGMDVHHLYQNKAERAEKIYGLLEKVGLNKEHANRFIHEFSGGQRQRIGIARLALRSYDLIIADEITASLDPDTSQQVMENLIAMPCMVVAITHDVAGSFMHQFDKVYRVEHGVVRVA